MIVITTTKHREKETGKMLTDGGIERKAKDTAIRLLYTPLDPVPDALKVSVDVCQLDMNIDAFAKVDITAPSRSVDLSVSRIYHPASVTVLRVKCSDGRFFVKYYLDDVDFNMIVVVELTYDTK